MYESSNSLDLPAGVFTTNWISPFLIASSMLGRPSCNFRMGSDWIPCSARKAWVPSVARILKPRS